MRNTLVLLLVMLGMVSTQAFAQNAILPTSTPDSSFSLPKLTWPRPFIYDRLAREPSVGNVIRGIHHDVPVLGERPRKACPS
jgi:hypothetical protein